MYDKKFYILLNYVLADEGGYSNDLDDSSRVQFFAPENFPELVKKNKSNKKEDTMSSFLKWWERVVEVRTLLKTL